MNEKTNQLKKAEEPKMTKELSTFINARKELMREIEVVKSKFYSRITLDDMKDELVKLNVNVIKGSFETFEQMLLNNMKALLFSRSFNVQFKADDTLKPEDVIIMMHSKNLQQSKEEETNEQS